MSLNEQQQAAVDCNDKKILCLAGAGAGKTHTMISRIIRLMEDGVDPRSILALTFTNAAAFEMKERCTKRSPGCRPPEFRTFHSFCYHLMSKDKQILTYLGYTVVPTVPEFGEMKKILAEAEMMTGIHLSDAKRSGKQPLNFKEKADLEILQKCEDKLMRQKGYITFDKLCYDVCKMFSSNRPEVEQYKRQYKYIFVDEFQDTDPRQWEFVSSFEDSSIFCVADALQAIYSFRGADSSIVKNLATNRDWTVIKMYQNYRSTKEIVDFANEWSGEYADSSYRLQLEATSHGPSVQKVSYYPDMYRNVDFHALEDMFKLPIPFVDKTSAILCRTNKEVDEVQTWFKDNGINFAATNKNNDAIHVLKSVTDSKYMIDWLATYLNAERYAQWIRILALYQDNEDFNECTEFVNRFSMVKAIHDRIRDVSTVRGIMRDATKPLVTRCGDILEVLGVNPFIIDTDAKKFSELCEYLIQKIEEERSSQIYIGTIHSVKGLEFDNVFLLGVDGKTFRLSNEENCNLYYVGITRAKENLVIYSQNW